MGCLKERVKLTFGIGCRTLLLLISGLLAMPAHVDALGFGALSLDSHLNQSLKADIPMLLNAADDMKTVRIELASKQEYRLLGLQWQSNLSTIKVLIDGKYSAKPMVQLRSSGSIKTPMLSIVLKAKKAGRGTYFKHYQLMLDAANLSKEVKQQEPLITLSLSGEEETAPAGVDASSEKSSGDVWARTWRYGPVQAGDSLSKIAYRLRLDKRFSNKQVMLSLYENNADAFVDGNINHLIKGIWLTVPRADVVKKYANDAAMNKFSQLLRRQNPTVEASKAKGVSALAPAAAATAVAPVAQPLRYSGKISLGNANAINSAVTELKQGIDLQFDGIHKGMMTSKLQMATLDESVSNLNVSMQGVKHDIHSLQKDIEVIKMRTEAIDKRTSATSADPFMTWQFALIVILLVVLIIVVVMMMMQKRKVVDESEADAELDTEFEPESDHLLLNDHHVNDVGMMESQFDELPDPLSEDPMSVSEDPMSVSEDPLSEAPSSEEQADFLPFGAEEEATPVADEADPLLNQIEESLSLCDYEKAEKTLDQVDAEFPDSLKASALRAQLYHETARLDKRNDLINQMSETSDEQRWERFCYFLPSHVWNACFGDSTAATEESQSPF